ncbi:LysM peptidoglycan-binding domain-containing protein [Ligilactobacillus salivarius]|jgi:LysM repeat protein|nr:LysM peptidoglycan-binding domain-containing protein [Lactobacillus sp.]MBZ4025630.1 LysM peptidoglycan-binding domain-containing protein [Ligilactobacillus salivarius]MBZ4032316.1 LysM peptidoglycan-binding domain-containing protein [Ligilactobacillus salivarius]
MLINLINFLEVKILKKRHKKKRRWIAYSIISVILIAILLVMVTPVKGIIVERAMPTAAMQKAEYESNKKVAREKYGVKVTKKESEPKKNNEEASFETDTMSSSSSSKKSKYITYTVKAGDNLTMLAEEYNTTIEEIMQVNGLTQRTVSTGTTLKIPKNSVR